MKFYIINLARSTDRKQHMVAQFEKLGITGYEFIKAVEGKGTANKLAEACMQSHRKVWQLIQTHGEPSVILEDDAVLHDSFYHYLTNRFETVRELAHVYMLGYQIHGQPLWNTFYPNWRFAQQGKTIEFNGAYAYLVNGEKAAKLLLELSKTVPAHPDLFMMDAANNGQLTLFFMNHPIVQHGGFQSTLKHHQEVKQPVNQKGKTVYQPPLGRAQSAGVKKISLVHPSRNRPQMAKKTIDEWLNAASGEIKIEHILSLDKNEPQLAKYKKLFLKTKSKVVINPNTDCVTATNSGAKTATGDVLFYLAEDFKCFKNWDLHLAEKFGDNKTPKIVKVDDGLVDFKHGIITHPAMNKLLYKKLKYLWHPAYKSMFVDEDLYWTAKNNGWLLEAPELKFIHAHHQTGNDETYRQTARHWDSGKATFEKRKAAGFPL